LGRSYLIRKAETTMPQPIQKEKLDIQDRLITVCASCGRVKTQTGRWIPVPIRFLQLMREHLSHGLCMHCAAALYPQVRLKASSHHHP